LFFRLPILLLVLAVLLVPRAASGGQTSPPEPKYDPATTVEFSAVVLEVREVPRNSPMRGLHFTVENGKESLDVYLGPVEFMKQFDFTFAKGDRIQVVGSRIKTAASPLVLAREIRRQSQTLYLRDSGGTPYWPPGS
jgi:hypothetical protein